MNLNSFDDLRDKWIEISKIIYHFLLDKGYNVISYGDQYAIFCSTCGASLVTWFVSDHQLMISVTNQLRHFDDYSLYDTQLFDNINKSAKKHYEQCHIITQFDHINPSKLFYET